MALLEVRDLHLSIGSGDSEVAILDGVSFAVDSGRTLGIVGESGSGKSLTCHSILRILPRAARFTGGQIVFDGRDLIGVSEAEMRALRGRSISMVLQDPMTSLNPLMTVGDQIAEPIRRHQSVSRADARNLAVGLLKELHISSPERQLGAYPHELSGGMRQRVLAAIALSCEPRLLLADEPTTALDATVQLQYLRLLKEAQERHGFGMVFVTHDFGIIGRMCDDVVVMYAGRVVETGATANVFANPRHPYTKALLAAVPRLDAPTDRLATIEGQPPTFSAMPVGCRFHPRCPHRWARCNEQPPTFARDGRAVACWLEDAS